MTTSSTWVARAVERPSGSLVAEERELLRGLLAWHRATLLHKCAGLSPAELATRSVEPSGLSLLGLLRHLRKVERIWWRTRVAGEDVEPLHGFGAGEAHDFLQADPETAQEDYEALLEEWAVCDRVAARYALDDEFGAGQDRFSLRFVHLHLIGEYARHNGHADLLRERVDGVVGA
ncbi:MAG: Mini-circle protein [Humibacillus sp.]|nr:Mini-circle protein [Humibacillus sp.]